MRAADGSEVGLTRLPRQSTFRGATGSRPSIAEPYRPQFGILVAIFAPIESDRDTTLRATLHPRDAADVSG